MKLIRQADAILNGIIGFLAMVSSVIVIGIMLLIGTDVTLRYAFNRPLGFTATITGILLLFITFLSAAWILKKEGHVSSDLVLNRLNPVKKALVNGITSVLGAIICLILTWYGALTTWDYYQRGLVTADLDLVLPQAPILMIIPIGCFLLLIQFMIRSYGYLKSWRVMCTSHQNDSSHTQ